MTQQRQYTVSDNKVLSKNNQPIQILFFKNGDNPVSLGLPPLRSVEDIDRLSRDQLKRYLNGYELPYTEKLANTRMKEHLKHALGLVGTYDNIFIFQE